MSPSELAFRIGVSVRMVHYYERGWFRPRKTVLANIRRVLRLTNKKLFEGIDDYPKGYVIDRAKGE
jgi:ribosome-binding protein aMBF1 (putative translation factor)